MRINFVIYPNSSIPKYLQNVNVIIKMIEDNILIRGSRLATICQSCSDLNVGRVRVINAFQELKDRGIPDSWHGKGFYVKSPLVAEIPD